MTRGIVTLVALTLLSGCAVAKVGVGVGKTGVKATSTAVKAVL